MSRSVVLVHGGARFSARVVPPLLDLLRDEGATVLLASAPQVPEELWSREGLTVVSLRPHRWRPEPGFTPTPKRKGGRLNRLRPSTIRAGYERRLRERRPEYTAGRETWGWVRRAPGVVAAAERADLVVAVTNEAVRAVWEIGRRSTTPMVVVGQSGAEAVVDSWHR